MDVISYIGVTYLYHFRHNIIIVVIDMKMRYAVLLMFIALVSISAVSAMDNQTLISAESDDALSASSDEDTLEKTYFYDEDGEEYVDDTVVTHNVVKYYGDEDTKFKVKVYDDDYLPMEGVYVSFRLDWGNYKEKATNSNGEVYFPLNYKVGKYYAETYIESEDGRSYWSADNTVTIKSTIPAKELVKFSTSKKKFKIRFLDTKGKALNGHAVKIWKNGHWYKLKTDSNGYVKIKSNFKVGKNRIIAYNPVSKEKRKIPVVVLKKGIHRVNAAIVVSKTAIKSKKLKNGDYIDTVYETEYRQYDPGVYAQANGGGLTNAKHTKLLKAKFYFKNKKTGKIITKTSKKVKYSTIKVKPIKGYTPYKATVWYKEKIKV